MRVVALLTIRNEELYLRRCLEHLDSQGVETCLIDNDSTDSSAAIAKEFRGRGVFRMERFPYTGSFELRKILQFEEKLASEIAADWFIHHDADEIRQAPVPGMTLRDGLEDADRRGYNAVDFDEFVFLPTSDEQDFEGRDFVAEMRHYYYHSPRQAFRINAWKNLGVPVNLSDSGGHRVVFSGRSVLPEKFVMRHYIALSRRHAIAKYGGRIYSMEEVKRYRWHGGRHDFAPDRLRFPPVSRLKTVSADGFWDRSDPWHRHEFLGRPKRRADANIAGEQAAVRMPMPFVVGVGRSGTTLLRLMLDSHPEMAIPPETHFLPALIRLLRRRSEARFPVKALLAAARAFSPAFDAGAVAGAITGAEAWNDFHMDAAELRREFRRLRPFSTADAVRRFYSLYAGRFGKSRFGDKTPNYLPCMTDIAALLPEARFIHLVRDGRDVAASFRKMWFGRGENVADQAAYWLSSIRDARQQAQSLPHYMEIRFEDLVKSPEETLRKICGFIELPFDDSMLRYHERSRERLDEFTDWRKSDGKLWASKNDRLAIFERTTVPPDQSRIGVYVVDLTPAEIRTYDGIAGDVLREFGYPA